MRKAILFVLALLLLFGCATYRTEDTAGWSGWEDKWVLEGTTVKPRNSTWAIEATDVTVSDDLTVTDDATISGDAAVTGSLSASSATFGGTDGPLLADTDGDGDVDVIGGTYAVDLTTSDTYAITGTGGDYSFDIDALDSDCLATLPEASLWIGKTIGICLSTANATFDLQVHPGDATDRYKDWDRATDLTSAADEYIAADGADECVYLQSVGADTIVIINADGALPTGWAEE